MKIGSLENKPPVAPATGERTAARPGQGMSSEEPSAQVALSPAASALARDPDFDAEKVMRIAQAIRDGRFTVNAQAIADKLILNARELLGGSH